MHTSRCEDIGGKYGLGRGDSIDGHNAQHLHKHDYIRKLTKDANLSMHSKTFALANGTPISVSSDGGGGNSSSDLRWDGRRSDEEEEAYRRRCLLLESAYLHGRSASLCVFFATFAWAVGRSLIRLFNDIARCGLFEFHSPSPGHRHGTKLHGMFEGMLCEEGAAAYGNKKQKNQQ